MTRSIQFCCLILLAGFTAVATHAQEGGSSDRSSPRALLLTFVEAMHDVDEGQPERWANATACLDLSDVGVEPESAEARDLARDLFGVLNRIEYIDFDNAKLPGALYPADDFLFFPRESAQYPDAVLDAADKAGFELTLVREDEAWRFSPEAVAQTPVMYEAVRGLPLVVGVDIDETELVTEEGLIESLMPSEWKSQRILTLAYWQWAGMFLLIFIGVTLDVALRFGLRTTVRRLVASQRVPPDRMSIADTLRPIGLFAAGVFWVLTVPLLGLHDLPQTIAVTSAKLFSSAFGILAAWRVVGLVADVAEARAKRTSSRFDDVLIPLVRKTAKIFVAAIGVVYAANALDINIMPLVASLGITSVAFAFAAKDTVENFFGSIAVLLDRPFHVGDWVVINDTEGTVEEVGFRSTRIRTFYNSQVTVPNSNLVRAVVDNYGRRKYRRWKTHVGVQYDTTPEQLSAFAEGIRELVRSHPYTRKDYFQVWVNGFGASSIDILLYIFHEVPDWSTELRERERLMLDIVRLADALGVSFAFPTQTLHLYQEEQADPTRQHAAPQSMTDRRAMITGIRKAQEVTANQTWQETKPGPVEFPEGPTRLDDEELAKYEVTEDTKSVE